MLNHEKIGYTQNNGRIWVDINSQAQEYILYWDVCYHEINEKEFDNIVELMDFANELLNVSIFNKNGEIQQYTPQ